MREDNRTVKSESHSQHSQFIFSPEEIVLSVCFFLVSRESSTDVLGSHTECSCIAGISRSEIQVQPGCTCASDGKNPKETLRAEISLVESVKGCPVQLRPFVPAGVREQSKVYF